MVWCKFTEPVKLFFFPRKATICLPTGDLFRVDSNKMQFWHNNCIVLNRSINYRGTLKNTVNVKLLLYFLLNGNYSQTVHKMRKPRNWQQRASRLHLSYHFHFHRAQNNCSERAHMRLWISWEKCARIVTQ